MIGERYARLGQDQVESKHTVSRLDTGNPIALLGNKRNDKMV